MYIIFVRTENRPSRNEQLNQFLYLFNMNFSHEYKTNWNTQILKLQCV